MSRATEGFSARTAIVIGYQSGTGGVRASIAPRALKPRARQHHSGEHRLEQLGDTAIVPAHAVASMKADVATARCEQALRRALPLLF